ncbi:hypothetical protein BDW67DRAFT_169198 [Aspergillus spinulosporus]
MPHRTMIYIRPTPDHSIQSTPRPESPPCRRLIPCPLTARLDLSRCQSQTSH